MIMHNTLQHMVSYHVILCHISRWLPEPPTTTLIIMIMFISSYSLYDYYYYLYFFVIMIMIMIIGATPNRAPDPAQDGYRVYSYHMI